MAQILYLSTDGLTDSLGGSQILPYLEKLSERHRVTIISLEKPKNEDKIELLNKALHRNAITWFPLTYHKRPPILATFFDLYRMRKKALSVCGTNKIDIVHSRSYLAGLIGLIIKRNCGTKFLFDTRGFWIDERIEGGIWNYSNPIYKLIVFYLRRKEKVLFKKADAIVLLTEKARTYIVNHKVLKPGTPIVEVIPCCTDEFIFSATILDQDELKQKRESLELRTSDFVVCYHGSLGTWYLMDEVFDFFYVLKDKHPTAKLLMITHDDSNTLKAKWEQRGYSPETLMVRHASRNEVPYYLALAQLCVFFIRPVFSKMASSPTKMGEIIFMNIPFITNSGVGDVDELIKHAPTGRLINSFNNLEYKRIVDELSVTPTDSNNTYLHQYFSLTRGVELYHSIYQQLLKSKHRLHLGNLTDSPNTK